MFSFFKRSPINIIHNIRDGIAPFLGRSLVVDDVRVTPEGAAIIVLRMTGDGEDNIESAKQAIENKVQNIRGVAKVMVILTGDKRPADLPASPTMGKAKASQDKVSNLPPVVIAVASGKGGVGKSTVAVNLALALQSLGKKVGMLDADIYGPSLPRLLGVVGQKITPNAGGLLNPISAHGLKAMSMGFLVEEASAMIWRGAMVQSALLQMLRDVDWSGLDILVIDMPPGTGDIHLTLAQRVPLSGGVVVSTPQDIALIDARKGLDMFRKVAVPILGIVENMAVFCCPNCGHHEPIFGTGGARAEAEKIGVPCLGEIPLHTRIRELSDAGTPVVAADPTSPQAQEFIKIAEGVLAGLLTAQKPAPIIRIEE